MKYISEVTQELGIESYLLHGWEKEGWLGNDPIMKDPNNNHARLYNDSQLERIYFLHTVIGEQKAKGIKRTNKRQIESLLLDKFGGEVIELPKNEMTVLPTSVETLIELITKQNQQLMALEEMVQKQKPIDYGDDFKKMQRELAFSQEREEKLISLIEDLQDKVDSLEDKTEKLGKKPKWKFWD